ncbi:uncharacterized protein LOC128865775 [Anastrepha ludens]|uniref:uncharacterized protein LOC128865775 n=1 Tax=Anastrepha ludens TaxID=28586 RepID=UPI0023B0EDEE|nr:uncharacterized protein LOC128865775 [Anastrepha ludens]
MKIIALVCVLFAFIARAYSASTTWGVQNTTDIIVLNQNIQYPAVRNTVQTLYFNVPASYQSNSKVISAIYLQDQFKNSSGPTNTLVWGGPGWTFATIQMKTQSSYGLNVTFLVYGR